MQRLDTAANQPAPPRRVTRGENGSTEEQIARLALIPLVHLAGVRGIAAAVEPIQKLALWDEFLSSTWVPDRAEDRHPAQVSQNQLREVCYLALLRLGVEPSTRQSAYVWVTHPALGLEDPVHDLPRRPADLPRCGPGVINRDMSQLLRHWGSPAWICPAFPGISWVYVRDWRSGSVRVLTWDVHGTRTERCSDVDPGLLKPSILDPAIDAWHIR